MAGGQQDVMIPLEQAAVPFYGRELIAVKLPDGRICAVLRWLCDGMQLDTQAQLRRIQRKTALRDDLLMVRVETEGGPQTMAALALHGLPGWLYTIDESRVASEAAREAVILFQREATDILFRYFATSLSVPHRSANPRLSYLPSLSRILISPLPMRRLSYGLNTTNRWRSGCAGRPTS